MTSEDAKAIEPNTEATSLEPALPPEIEPAPVSEADSALSPGFSIVGIGASAGGLEAFEQFFRALPRDTGLAYVLVSHLDPSHVSLLTDIMQCSTTLPVVQAQESRPRKIGQGDK